MSTNQKFQDAQNKLILQATRVAGNYLLSHYGSAHISGDPKVELTHTIDSNSSEIIFNGKITVFAEGLLNPVVGVNMTVNSNDIDVESEESIQSKIVEALNAQQEAPVVKASLDGFKLTDSGNYLKVSHSALEDADLGIVAKSEYEKSPNKQELLQTIVKDAMSRVANETTITFEGSFVEPIIEKKAAGCDQCDAAMINGVFCHEHGCPNKKKQMHDDDMLDSEEGYVESKKSSWLTADLMSDEEPMPDMAYVTLRENPEFPEAVGLISEMEDSTVADQKAVIDQLINYGLNSMAHELERLVPQEYEDFIVNNVEDINTESNLSIQENMPKATLSNKLSQDMQLEDQKLASANEKIKTEAVNALVSMLKGMGFGSSKIAEVSNNGDKLDLMVTLDDAGTTKAVNIPVEIKADKVVLPKRSLVAELISKGLDIQAKLTESFSQEVIEKLAAIEEKIAYEQKEAQDILNERKTVTKIANESRNTMFEGDTDTMTLQKHLLSGWEDMKEGDQISDGTDSWEIVNMNAQQNSKGENDSSEWTLKKCKKPEADKEPKGKMSL